MPNRPDVLAAGAVVLRKNSDDVLLVHRPKYDDWSFPKGKLDRGEHATSAAVREVLEETGLPIRLGRRSPTSATRSRRPQQDGALLARAGGRRRRRERLRAEPRDRRGRLGRRWKAAKLLTYRLDVDTLREALTEGRAPGRWSSCGTPTHAPASGGKADDRFRPLLATGTRAGRAAGAAAGGVRRDPAGHLQQHPLRADRHAVRRGSAAWPSGDDGL